jgi:hypothetical protein
MATAAAGIVAPPPGFELEGPTAAPVAAAPAIPPPPAGFELEAAAPAPAAAPAAPKYDPNDPRFTHSHQGVAATLRGVPVLGAGLEKAGAGISALAQPLTGVGSDKSTIAERYVDNLEQEEAAKADYEKAHPVENALAGTLGGTLALGGAGGASPAVAKALGMTGSLVPAATRAAVSGAGIGSLDAALRGEDPTSAATMGAITGVGGVVAGKAVGKVWDAATRTWRAPKAAVPAHTIDVNGEQVPVRPSALTGDMATAQEEQAIIHGQRGESAQQMAQEHTAASDAALDRTHARMAAELDPTGSAPSTSPQAAGEAVSAELAGAEQARAAAEAQRLTAATTERARIKKKLQLPGSPDEQPDLTPLQGVEDITPAGAAEEVALGLRREATKAATARDAAYEELANKPGEYNPAVFQKTATRIKAGLSAGDDPVFVDAVNTPNTANALADIETNVGQRRFENQAETPLQMGPDGRPMERPITLQTIDTARKRLINMQRAANVRARTSGDYSDARGMRRVIKEFDDHVANATRTPGGFSGDAEDALSTLGRARKLHSDLKKTFGPQNPQDDVGKAIEKIVGKRGATPAEIETVAPLLYGNQSEPGGALQTRVAQRIKQIFGEKSKEWAAHRQGLFSHLTETPHGIEAMSNEKIADRLHKFFSGTKGVGLSQTLFSPSERAKLLTHANRLRMAADPHPEGQVEKLIAKWAGRGGHEQASAKTVIDGLMGASGKKGLAPQIVKSLKTHLTPKGLNQLKQGVWSRITEPPEGMIDWGHQKQAQRIHDFLNGDGKGLADELFTKGERDKMAAIARGHKAMIPPEGSTNPSRSGHVTAKAIRAASHSVMPLIGLHTGGLPGAAIAYGADKMAGRVVDRFARNRASKLFYGPQKGGPASTLPQTFGALAGAIGASQSR